MTCPYCKYPYWYEDIIYLKGGKQVHKVFCGNVKCNKLIKEYEKEGKNTNIKA